MKHLPSQNKPRFEIKKTSKKELKWWHKVLFLSPIFLIAIIFKAEEWYCSYLLAHDSDSTLAVLTKVTFSGVRDEFDTENVAFEYKVGDSIYIGYVSVPVNHRFVIGPLGLPLFSGQRYKLYFVRYKPHIYRIDITKPDSATVESFIQGAAKILQKINPSFSYLKNYCIATNIFKYYQYDGLAHIFFYDEYIVENFKHNTQKFKRFWQEENVKKIIKECEAVP